MEITCLSKEQVQEECGGPASACANRKECKITLSNEQCKSIGLKENSKQKISHNEFRSISQCQNSNIYDEENGFHPVSCCIVRHEYAHICDPRPIDEPHPKNKCSETYADNYAVDVCMRETVDYYCKPSDPNIPYPTQRWPYSACRGACTDAFAMASLKILDACLCSKIAGSDKKNVDANDCCNCARECLNVNRLKKLLPSSCGMYMTDIPLTDYCLGKAESVDCRYFGGPSNFTRCNCSPSLRVGANCPSPTPIPFPTIPNPQTTTASGQ
jgi:hypothetical protein